MIRYSAVISDGTFPCGTAVLQGDVRKCFARAKEAGYDCVQLTVRAPSDYPAELLNALRGEFGLAVSAMATGRMYSVDGLCMGSSDEENRRQCVGRLRAFADLSAQIGRPAVVIGAVRGYYRDAASQEDYYRQFDKSLRELAEYCEARSVPVILEAIDHLEADAYCDPGEALRYVESIGSPALHMYLDVMHLLNEGKDIPATIRTYGSKAWQIDVSGENRCAPMNSALDYGEITRAIRESGFDGVLAFEHLPEPPADAARKSLSYIRALLLENRRGSSAE